MKEVRDVRREWVSPSCGCEPRWCDVFVVDAPGLFERAGIS
jgi:hypothetical protein